MASVYKTINDNDVTHTRTLLYESLPMTGSILSGTYGAFQLEGNVKNYSHGMFQSVYDYPYLSSSSNHLFDITVGYAAQSALSASTNVQNAAKINTWTRHAQLLMGYNESGSVQPFDRDGDLTSGAKLTEAYFVNFSRLLVKDEIKKGTFSMILGVSSSFTGAMQEKIKIDDVTAGGENGIFKINSPAGEYGILKASNYLGNSLEVGAGNAVSCGLIFYQAGIVVLSSSIFTGHGGFGNSDTMSRGILSGNIQLPFLPEPGTNGFSENFYANANAVPDNIYDILTGSSISGASDALRHRIHNISFNNTTELHSTIYFCRVNHNDFNYSSNPTYISGSKIVTKSVSTDAPISYITTIGLYSADSEVMAMAKLSEPIKNTPDNELTFRVRLDY